MNSLQAALGYIGHIGYPAPMVQAVRLERGPGKTRPLTLSDRTRAYPQLRFMGSKHRLLPWLQQIFGQLEFDTALDAFSGSGCVAYLLKDMGKEVATNDFLNFTATISKALIENAGEILSPGLVQKILQRDPSHPHFVEKTFKDIFFTPQDLRFLDSALWNVRKLSSPYQQALARAALIRSCIKRQPRGVFTVAGDPERYKDGRRDLRLSLREHFMEQAQAFSASVFDNGRRNRAFRGDVFEIDPQGYDLVYMDPPYVPRSDDNCYMKRYHFLEGLSLDWEGVTLLETSKVKKIKKPYTPFSYRGEAIAAFNQLFSHFRKSILVLSYSSNGYPDLEVLTTLMRRYKSSVTVFEREHRYHFGTHHSVKRSLVQEYLIVGE